MLVQLHWQYRNNVTKFIAQFDIQNKNYDDFHSWIREIQLKHPIPEEAIWMACNESSEYFISNIINTLEVDNNHTYEKEAQEIIKYITDSVKYTNMLKLPLESLRKIRKIIEDGK